MLSSHYLMDQELWHNSCPTFQKDKKKKAPLSTATYTLYCVYVVHHQPQINPVSASTISLSDLVCAGQKLTLICASKKEKKP